MPLALLLLAAGLATEVSSSPFPLDSNVTLTKRDAGYGFVAGTASWQSSSGSGPNYPIISMDGGVNVFYQTDGNLVILQGNNVVWASYPQATARNCGGGKCSLVFQGDGNLVAYDNNYSPAQAFWSTGTNSYPGHSVPADALYFRNSWPWIQMYTKDNYNLWQTKQGGSGADANNPDAEVESSLGFTPGNIRWYSKAAPFAELNGGKLFYLQQDGNIVVKQQGNGQLLWNSGTSGHGCGDNGCYLAFQQDGNLVAWDATVNPASPYWSTRTYFEHGEHQAANALFWRNSDPYIALYDSDGQGDFERLWESHGTQSYTSYNPDHETGGNGGGGGGGGLPCGDVSCQTCDFSPCGSTGTLLQPE